MEFSHALPVVVERRRRDSVDLLRRYIGRLPKSRVVRPTAFSVADESGRR